MIKLSLGCRSSLLCLRVPARRWGEPSDFAAPAVYLMSDGSRYHTGDTLVIDGGYTKF